MAWHPTATEWSPWQLSLFNDHFSSDSTHLWLNPCQPLTTPQVLQEYSHVTNKLSSWGPLRWQRRRGVSVNGLGFMCLKYSWLRSLVLHRWRNPGGFYLTVSPMEHWSLLHVLSRWYTVDVLYRYLPST